MGRWHSVFRCNAMQQLEVDWSDRHCNHDQNAFMQGFHASFRPHSHARDVSEDSARRWESLTEPYHSPRRVGPSCASESDTLFTTFITTTSLSLWHQLMQVSMRLVLHTLIVMLTVRPGATNTSRFPLQVHLMLIRPCTSCHGRASATNGSHRRHVPSRAPRRH